MDAIMTQTFNTMLFILNSYLWAMGISGVFLLAIVLIPHREDAHDLLDRIYDAGNNLLDWLGNTTHKVVEEVKGIATLAALPFVWIGQGLWDLTKVVSKGLAISAVVLTAVSFTAVVLAGSAAFFWLTLPLVLAYVAARKAISTVKAAKAKVSEMIAARKAAAIAAAEAAEIARLEAVKAEAISLGFVSSGDVAKMIADAIKAHENNRHEDLDLKVEAVTIGLSRAVARQAKAARLSAEDMEVVELVENAQAVVLKSIEEMTIQEMREELGCGKRFNTVQLRAKVRAARANS